MTLQHQHSKYQDYNHAVLIFFVVIVYVFLFFSIALFVINFLITYCQPQLDLFYNSLYLYKGKPNQERVTSLWSIKGTYVCSVSLKCSCLKVNVSFMI